MQLVHVPLIKSSKLSLKTKTIETLSEGALLVLYSPDYIPLNLQNDITKWKSKRYSFFSCIGFLQYIIRAPDRTGQITIVITIYVFPFP